MSPALNESSTLERFERSNASEIRNGIRNGIMFRFLPGDCHICQKQLKAIEKSEMDRSVTISMPRETQKSLMAYAEESPWGALT